MISQGELAQVHDRVFDGAQRPAPSKEKPTYQQCQGGRKEKAPAQLARQMSSEQTWNLTQTNAGWRETRRGCAPLSPKDAHKQQGEQARAYYQADPIEFAEGLVGVRKRADLLRFCL